MPSLDYPCEFCNVVMRRDAIASHVKAKHTEELKQRFFKEYTETERKEGTIIYKVMAYKDPLTMVIESQTIEEAEYWFGVKPDLFIEDDTNLTDKGPSRLQKAKTAYLHSKQNLEFHLEFIKSIVNTITLLDMMNHNINVLPTTPEFINLKKSETNLRIDNKKLKEEAEISRQTYISIFKENEEMKLEMGIPDTVQLFHLENKANKLRVTQLQNTIQQHIMNIKDLEQRNEDLDTSRRQANLIADSKIFDLEQNVSTTVSKAEKVLTKKLKKEAEAKEAKKKKAKKLKKIADMDSDSESDSE